MKTVVILVLVAAAIFMADRLARIENQRFALMTGACPPAASALDDPCLATVRSRPSWAWQVFDGLTLPMPAMPLTSPD